MGKSSKSLKNALQSQQTRFKVKQKASHAAQIAEQKARKMHGGRSAPKIDKSAKQGKLSSNVKGKGPSTRRPTVPFQSTDTILLIGEGNFSFALALARPSTYRTELAHLAHLPPKNITATAYDSEKDCYSKYPEGKEIVASLRELGVEVLFAVDATKLEWVSALKGRSWSKIVWNFPHAGTFQSLSPSHNLALPSGKGIDNQDRNILSNQMLLLGFLRSAAKFLKQGPVPSIMGAGKKKRKDGEDDEEEEIQSEHEELDNDDADIATQAQTASTRGTILVTLRNVEPYTSWFVCLTLIICMG